MSHSINGHFTPASLLKFAAPSIIMMMFMSLYTIIDGIFIIVSKISSKPNEDTPEEKEE